MDDAVGFKGPADPHLLDHPFGRVLVVHRSDAESLADEGVTFSGGEGLAKELFVEPGIASDPSSAPPAQTGMAAIARIKRKKNMTAGAPSFIDSLLGAISG
jgi:hypothetical protein